MRRIILSLVPTFALLACDSPGDEVLEESDLAESNVDDEFAESNEDEAHQLPNNGPAAVENAPESPEALYGCGLQREDYGSYWVYTVKNCNGYPIKRRVAFGTGNPSACHHYGIYTPENMFSDTSKRRPDHLIGC